MNIPESPPGAIMDALFAKWDAERGAPDEEIRVWAKRELDRAFAEQAKLASGGDAAKACQPD
jgi:hypothetical protein